MRLKWEGRSGALYGPNASERRPDCDDRTLEIPVSDEVVRDPYVVYRRLRDRDPIHRMRLVDAWGLTRYEDADAVLRGHKRFSAEDRRFHDTGLTTMLDIDPPVPMNIGD